MSGDLSPLPGSGLDTEARPDAAPRPPVAEPSLIRVLGTTLHLWLRRRVLRVPDGRPAGALRWTALAAGVLVVLGAASGGVAAGLTGPRVAPPRPRHHPSRPAPNPVQTLTTANEQAAAGWLAAQVTGDTSVACDPTMCGYLQAAGLAAGQQVVLEPGSSLPSLSGVLIVATPVIRSQAGAVLTSQALDVIASFGSGQEAVQVRVTTAAGYIGATRHEIAADAKAGRALLRSPRLHLSGVARRQLVGGHVDPRLLVVLRRLVAARQLYVTGFGDAGPGASWPALLRSVSVNRLVHGTGRHRVNDAPAVLRLLRAQRPPYRASVQEQSLAGGQIVLTIQFPAPSPV